MFKKFVCKVLGCVSITILALIGTVVDVTVDGWSILFWLFAAAVLAGCIASFVSDPHAWLSRMFAAGVICMYCIQLIFNFNNETLRSIYRLRNNSSSLSCMYYSLVNMYYHHRVPGAGR